MQLCCPIQVRPNFRIGLAELCIMHVTRSSISYCLNPGYTALVCMFIHSFCLLLCATAMLLHSFCKSLVPNDRIIARPSQTSPCHLALQLTRLSYCLSTYICSLCLRSVSHRCTLIKFIDIYSRNDEAFYLPSPTSSARCSQCSPYNRTDSTGCTI